MASGISPSRLHLIPVGIPDKPLPDRPFPYELKSREGAFRILFVGALEPWKDPMVLLRAADLLRDHPFHFVFIGDGPLKASMVKWIRDKNLQDVVQLIGPLPKAQQYMGHFDCLVLPSREEAFGLVILEALQKGLPVVVSHCPSFQEILRPLQKTYSFPQKNAQALAEVLLNLLRDPEGARQWVYQAQEKVLPQYTLSTIAQRYMALYQNLLSSPA